MHDLLVSPPSVRKIGLSAHKVEVRPRDLARKNPSQTFQRTRSRPSFSTLCVPGSPPSPKHTFATPPPCKMSHFPGHLKHFTPIFAQDVPLFGTPFTPRALPVRKIALSAHGRLVFPPPVRKIALFCAPPRPSRARCPSFRDTFYAVPIPVVRHSCNFDRRVEIIDTWHKKRGWPVKDILSIDIK